MPLLIMLLGLIFLSCAQEQLADSEAELRQEVKSSNYCNVAEDCALIKGEPLFVCGALVNVALKSKLQKKVDEFNEKCKGSVWEYDKENSVCEGPRPKCPAGEKIVCESGSCGLENEKE